jgi:hypothetical protein
MKTMVITIADPADGDLVIVNAEAPRGGKTSVKHRVIGARQRPVLDEHGFATSVEDVPAQTARDIAVIMAELLTGGWLPGQMEAKPKGDNGALVVHCTQDFSDLKFSTEVHGDGGTKATLEEF